MPEIIKIPELRQGHILEVEYKRWRLLCDNGHEQSSGTFCKECGTSLTGGFEVTTEQFTVNGVFPIMEADYTDAGYMGERPSEWSYNINITRVKKDK